MLKSVFTIVSNEEIAFRSYRLELIGDCCSQVPAAGQFVDIAIPGYYLRRPISVCDADDRHITLIYKTVGAGTKELSGFRPGQELELLLPLGHGFDPDAVRDSALLVGGGLGSAPMYFLAKALLARGKKLSVVLGFNRACEIVLRHASPETVCGIVRNIGREGERMQLMTLRELAEYPADMFTTVFIGNRQTKVVGGRMVTPRGYRDV